MDIMSRARVEDKTSTSNQGSLRNREKFESWVVISTRFGFVKPKTRNFDLVDQVLRYSNSYKDEIYLLNKLKGILRQNLN